MSRQQPDNDPTITDQLITELNLAFENKLIHSIDELSDQIMSIEAVSGPTRRTQQLREERNRLELRLADTRDHVQFDL